MNIKQNLIVIVTVLAATLVEAQGQDPARQLIEQSRRQAEEQRTNEKLNNPRPGDRLFPNQENGNKQERRDQEYYYYDGGRWNRHRDIWVGQESIGGKANGSTDESE